MPTQNIAIYIKDEDYHKFLSKKRQIIAKITQLVKEELEGWNDENGDETKLL